MPLFYSISGFSAPYVLPPVVPVGAVFSNVLSSEMSRTGGADEEALPSRSQTGGGVRGYASSLHEHVRSPVLIAGHVMTTPVQCISSELPLNEVHELMRKKRFRHLPVISKEGKLVGMVSDRDILRAGVLENKRVGEYMSSKVLTATAETSIRDVAEALLENRIGGLPIIDDDHEVVGILTTTDILKAVVQRAPLELWA